MSGLNYRALKLTPKVKPLEDDILNLEIEASTMRDDVKNLAREISSLKKEIKSHKCERQDLEAGINEVVSTQDIDQVNCPCKR